MTVGHPSEVTNLLEAVRQHVEQEPTNELFSFKGHPLCLIAVTVVLPTERDVPVFKREQSVIGDRHSVSVAAQIIEDLLRPAKGMFRIHGPFLLASLRKQPGERVRVAFKLKLVPRVGSLEVMKEQSAKQRGQDSNREKEAGPATDPTLVVKRQTSGRDHAVKMRMEH